MISSNKLILTLSAVLILFLCFTSCSNNNTKNTLVGKWKIDHANDEMMEFFKDGTFKSYTPFRFGPGLGYSSVKTENGNYKITNGDTLEISVGEDKSKIARLNVKFSDENSMTLSSPNGDTLFTLTRAR